MDQHFQDVASKLAALLVNNVELAVGDAFPIGWNLLTGDREYASISEQLLQEAQCLSATLECEATLEDDVPRIRSPGNRLRRRRSPPGPSGPGSKRFAHLSKKALTTQQG